VNCDHFDSDFVFDFLSYLCLDKLNTTMAQVPMPSPPKTVDRSVIPAVFPAMQVPGRIILKMQLLTTLSEIMMTKHFYSFTEYIRNSHMVLLPNLPGPGTLLLIQFSHHQQYYGGNLLRL